MTRLSNHLLSRGRPLLVVLAAGRASSIRGSFSWGHLLKVDEANLSKIHCFIRGMFSWVHGYGSCGGRAGGMVRLGQEHLLAGSLLAATVVPEVPPT